jgi:dGTPase
MHLTFSQILAALKYPRGPLENAKIWDKAGFFESERDVIEEAWRRLNFKAQQRFPLAYIVEAADDISYCISDMEDGIDQRMFEPLQFFQLVVEKWNPKNELRNLRELAETSLAVISKDPKDFGTAKDLFFKFKTEFGGEMIKKAASLYGDGSAREIREGNCGLFDCQNSGAAADLLNALKEIARERLYPAEKVQRPFLAGRKIVRGILEEYGQLLELTDNDFTVLKDAYRAADRKKVREQQLETFLPLLDLLPSHYLEVYEASVERRPTQYSPQSWEWFCRAHLVVDYLAGMTDDFAYRTYQVISGVSLG